MANNTLIMPYSSAQIGEIVEFKRAIGRGSPVKPLRLRLGAACYDTPTWAKVFVAAARAMLDGARTRKPALATVKRFSWMGHNSNGMRRPCELEPGVWVELNRDALGLIVRTKMLLEACGYPLDQASFEWEEVSHGEMDGKTEKKVSHAKPVKCVKRRGNMTAACPQIDSSMRRYMDAIAEYWPDGFDFSDGAVRLLEARCGRMTRKMEADIKSVLFRPHGKLWIHPECVADKEAFKNVSGEIEHAIDEAGFVSAAFVAAKTLEDAQRLRDDKERCEFVKFIARWNEWKVVGHGNMSLIAPEDFNEREALSYYCDFVKECVQEGMIRLETLTSAPAFANVTQTEMVSLMREYEPTVIPERDADGDLSFKMLSEYYLPEDFDDAVSDVLAKAEVDGVSPTAAFFASAFSERYGCDFAQDYALDTAYSLKWVIDAVWSDHAETQPPRRWIGDGARARFALATGDTDDDLPSQVESAFSGVFTNDEFWDYASTNYGLASTKEAKIAQLGYLAPRFVRIDRDRWMSIDDFREAVGWDLDKSTAMAEVLRETLGSAPLLPMAALGATTLDALPEIGFRWTPELAASVAALLCPDVCVANHGAAPFAVTTLLVPRPISSGEIVRYVLGVYVARNPHERNVEGAFEFLQANNIRFRLTKNCRSEIESFLVKVQGEGR